MKWEEKARGFLEARAPGSVRRDALTELIREGEDHRFEETADELLRQLKKHRELINTIDKEVKAVIGKR